MSAICGIVLEAGREVDPGEAGELLDHLKMSGPDGARQWIRSRTFLGHTLLATEMAPCPERFPLTHAESGCTITADARIDNREELIDALGLGRWTAPPGDGELILQAYLRWGDACPSRLLGDFAFAIWDPRAERLFCARDPVGMRPFHYFHQGECFVFSSLAGSLRRYAGGQINDTRIADFLLDLEAINQSSTFFEGVYKLEPSHSLIFADSTLELAPYSSVHSIREPRRLDFAEASAEVRHGLEDAVRCRLRGPEKVGIALSGGVDSSAIAALSKSLFGKSASREIVTFSCSSRRDDDAVEASHIRRAIDGLQLPSRAFYPGDIPDRADLYTKFLDGAHEPFDGVMMFLDLLYRRASSEGIKVILDGATSDAAFHTEDIVRWHWRNLAPRGAWREARAQEALRGLPQSAMWLLMSGLWRAFVPKPVRQSRQAAMRLIRPRQPNSLLEPGFARAIGMAERVRIQSTASGWREESEYSTALPWHVTLARERYQRVAAARGIEARDPFADIRFLALCRSLAPDQREFEGWPKFVLRQAVAGLVPHEIRWRRTREHLGWAFVIAAFDELKNRMVREPGALDRLRFYVRPDRIAEFCRPQPGEPSYEDTKILFLGLWLSANQ